MFVLGTELCDGQQPGEGAGGQVLPAGVRGAEQVLDVHAGIDLLQSAREKLLLLLLLLLIQNFEREIDDPDLGTEAQSVAVSVANY